MKFSNRYGYLKPSEVIIREQITPEIQNAICTCFDALCKLDSSDYGYAKLEWHLWCNFLNKRMNDFGFLGRHRIVATDFIENKDNPWYRKLDIIEATIEYLDSKYTYEKYAEKFSSALNTQFERLNFGYRIVDGLITEITSEQEIKTIETALIENKNNVSMHLNNALKLYSQRPEGDYRNSIKESISAVEALNRKITGEKVLNFSKMESHGFKIPSVLRKAFENLYGYSNDEKTGIRHSLMDETAEYLPGADEALYMLITCSAFINYLNNKLNINNDQI